MKTINNISLREAQKVLECERGETNNDVRLWPLRDYLTVKDSVVELCEAEDPLLVPKETIKARITYKLNYRVEDIPDKQLSYLLELFANDSIGSLHCILAVIATPKSKWRKRTLEQKAEDLLSSNFLEALAASFYFISRLNKNSYDYRLKKLKEKVFSKKAELTETVNGLTVSLN